MRPARPARCSDPLALRLVVVPRSAPGMEDELTPDNVAERLREGDTRRRTLQGLEALPAPVPRELALTAAPVLVDVAVVTEDREELEWCGLLVARLLTEAAPDPNAVYSAAFGGERLVAYFAPRLIVQVTQQALGGHAPLTRENAYSYVCAAAWTCPANVRGLTAPVAAVGCTAMEYIRTVSPRPPHP